MLEDILLVDQVFIACGPTDFRKAIDGLTAIVSAQFKLDPFSKSIYLFCNRKKDKLKALVWDDNGFILIYKSLEEGKFQWPQTPIKSNPKQIKYIEQLEGKCESQVEVLEHVRLIYSCRSCYRQGLL